MHRCENEARQMALPKATQSHKRGANRELCTVVHRCAPLAAGPPQNPKGPQKNPRPIFRKNDYFFRKQSRQNKRAKIFQKIEIQNRNFWCFPRPPRQKKTEFSNPAPPINVAEILEVENLPQFPRSVPERGPTLNGGCGGFEVG